MKKRIITLAVLLVLSGGVLFSKAPNRPPLPTVPPNTDLGGNSVEQETPVGTGTLMLLVMSGAFAGYKVVRNRKREDCI